MSFGQRLRIHIQSVRVYARGFSPRSDGRPADISHGLFVPYGKPCQAKEARLNIIYTYSKDWQNLDSITMTVSSHEAIKIEMWQHLMLFLSPSRILRTQGSLSVLGSHVHLGQPPHSMFNSAHTRGCDVHEFASYQTLQATQELHQHEACPTCHRCSQADLRTTLHSLIPIARGYKGRLFYTCHATCGLSVRHQVCMVDT
jgi:hypothetical protein